MVPGAGLYLPNTLSRPLHRTEIHNVKRKYFERKSSRDLDSDRRFITLARKSSEDVTRVFTSLATVFDFAEFASRQDKVSSENEVFVNLLQRVRHDVTEASRLYTCSHAVRDYLEIWPDKKAWIDAILLDIQRALNDIGLTMETVRVSGDDGGTVGLRRKFEWVLSHQKKLMSKQHYLVMCHQSLMAAVQVMQTAEMRATFDPIYEMSTQSGVEDAASEVLRSPHSRQRWRMNRRNASAPNITISGTEAEDDNKTMSQHSVLAELPGSTPDLPRQERLGLHASSSPPRRRSIDDSLLTSGQNTTESTQPNHAAAISSSPTKTDSSPQQLAQRQLPDDPSSLRRSFDHLQSSTSALDDRARASFDRSRPRAYSGQVRTQRSFEMKARTSDDQVRPMPTLAEKPIERLNSTASVAIGDAVTIPIASMLYRSKPVHVRKPPTKHRSLPSQLPSFPSQTSLMDDLSSWVIPPSARESYRSVQSADTYVSISTSTPGTSVASSPVLSGSPTSSPILFKEDKSAMKLPAAEALPTLGRDQESAPTLPITERNMPDLPSRPPPPPPSPILQNEPTMASSHPSTTSQSSPDELYQTPINEAIPPPMNRRPVSVAVIAKNTDATSNDTLTTATQSNSNTFNKTFTIEVATTIDASKAEHDVYKRDSPKESEIKNSVHPQMTPSEFSQTGTPIDGYPLASPNVLPPTTDLPTQSPSSETSNVETAPIDTPPAPTQPMTAQAKRRAAHARRMQLAFASESENTETNL